MARGAKKDVKTAKRAVKTAERTVKTAKESARASARAGRRGAHATTIAVVGATVKAARATLRMARDAARALAAAIAAGGWVVIAVVLVICLLGLLLASPFGSFFTDESAGADTLSPSAAMARINTELDEKLSELQASGGYDRLEVKGGPPDWTEVFSVFAASTAAEPDARPVSILDGENLERLRTVFWDMTKLTTAESEVEHPASGDTEAWTEKVLTVTITPRTPDDMRVFYSFDGEQNSMLDELLTAESLEVWEELLAGSSGEIVSVALSQVGNRKGRPYWSWYGFPSHVSWCACFVSWCANECGVSGRWGDSQNCGLHQWL